MIPKPFRPMQLCQDSPFVRDQESDLVWHRVLHRILYIDTDRSQVVYHSHYLRYFERGRATLMRDLGYPYKEVEENGFVYPVIEMGASYHHPLFYDDPIWINTRPALIEKVRIWFDYIITHQEKGTLICKGFTSHCALGKSGRPTRIDPHTLKLWERFPS